MEENKELSIKEMIFDIRGHKVMLDSHLANLYQVEVKALNRAVKRNIKRFPVDFMFQLTIEEWENLKSFMSESFLLCQFGTAKMVEKIRYNPYVFTEQGIAMLSGLLSSDIAINVNIQIMRAFVRLRHIAMSQNSVNMQITELHKLLMLHIDNNDSKFSEHEKAIRQIMRALNNLVEKPKKNRTIGFCTGKS